MLVTTTDMKTIPVVPHVGLRRAFAPVTVTAAVLSTLLLGGASTSAQNTNFNWIAASPSDDFSVASDWDQHYVPNGTTNCVVLLTNGVACNYNSTDTNFIGQMQLAALNNSIGTFVMNSGALLISNSDSLYPLIVGGGETPNTASETAGVSGFNGTANLTINGGTFTVVRNTSSLFQDGFMVGLTTNASGTVTINGGLTTILCGLEIGLYGFGTVNVNGGTTVDNGWFGVGRGNGVSYGSGIFNMTGGTLYVLRNAGSGDHGIALAQGTTNAAVNISGGTIYTEQVGFNGTKATEAFNLSGGDIYVGYAGVSAAADTNLSINISGGTFQTVDLPIPPANGNTNFPSDGTNWLWASTAPVNLTNNSFLVNGIAGPGNVTFAPEINRAITLTNKWSGVGGMTLAGPGILAVNATNTLSFSGPLAINGGTLAVNSANSLGMAVTVNGGILDLAAANGFAMPITLNNGVLALAAAQRDTNGVAIDGGIVAILNGGSLQDSSLSFAAGSSLIFTNTSTITFTNIIVGAGNILLNNSGVVNLGNNVQNTGVITQNNGVLVLNGTISSPATITNSGPASVGPLVLQGNITTPIGIGTNSAMELGTTAVPGTLDASNLVLDGTWDVKINTATSPGGGTNDLLVCSNLTVNSGSSVLNVLPLSLPTAGTYVIGQYSGIATGSFSVVTNGLRNTTMSVQISGGQILLTVGASTPANLIWSAPIGSTNLNWDVETSSNWLNFGTSALDVFHQQDNVTFSNTAGATPVTNRVSLLGQIMPNTITISGGLPYIFNGFGYISGGASITYNDTNTSGIYTGGNNYSGPVYINNGVLQLGIGGSAWLGSTNGATYIDGGTLDLNGQSVGSEPLVIQGTGSAFAGTNSGAINNSGAASSQSGGPLNITLAGNSTLNASGNRWDIGKNTLGAGGGSFTGNGFNLTKIGGQALWMHELGDIGVGNIDVQQGTLGIQFTIGLGNPSDSLKVESGATLSLYQVVSNLNKQLVLNGNATVFSGGGTGTSNNFVGPITLNGTNSIQTSGFPLNLPGNIGGTGGFNLSGTGTLYLGGVDTYSGPTVLAANSTIALESGASIPDTSLIYMTPATNTIIDASAAGSMTLNSGQTVEGSGSILGNITAGTGSSLTPGTNTTTYGTIVFPNNLTLNGDTNYLKISDSANIGVDNDLIKVNNTLTLNGVSTLVISPLAALDSGTPYTVMQAGSIAGSGSLNVVSTSPRYTMTSQISGNLVQVNVMGNAAPLEWEGYLTPNWDLVTSNWNNMATSNHDHFYNGDNPTFDDTATITSVVLTNNVVVGGIYMSNVTKTYTFSGGGVITGPLNMYGNGSTCGPVILAMSNAPALAYVDSQFGDLVYDVQNVTNYNVYTIFGDSAGFGQGNIVFGGSNTVNLLSDNYDNVLNNSLGFFDGMIWVTNGILRYTNDVALGRNDFGYAQGVAVTATNTGTLDINGVPLDPGFTAHISGTGFNGMGALYDSKVNAMSSDNPPSGGGGFNNLVFDADVTIGSPNNLQQNIPSGGSAGQVNGQGFKLTKVGTGNLSFFQQADGDTHFGDIDVVQGHLSLQGYAPSGQSIALGDVTKVLSVESNAVVTFFSIWNGADTVHNGLNKVMWLKGDAYLDSAGNSSGNSNNFIGPVFLSGTNIIGTRGDLHFWNTIMDSNGPGGFVLGSTPEGAPSEDLWLDGANSYSGATIISNRTVHVGASSSLGLSTYVQVNSGATLDLSATPVYNFGTTQTNEIMAGNGTVTGPTTGNLNFNAGGTLAIGLPTTNGTPDTNTFTLTIHNAVVFNTGSTNYVVANKTSPTAGAVPVDKLSGPTSLTLGGTVVVTNYGTHFVAGDSLALFSATTITTNSGFNIVPATPGPNLAWNISSIPVNGTLGIVSTLVINTNATNIVFSISGNQLTLSWPADHTGWELEIQTNSLARGLSNNWVPNPGSTSGDSFMVPINLTNGTVFYRLVYPPQ